MPYMVRIFVFARARSLLRRPVPEKGLARMAAESPNSGDYFLSQFDIAKKLATCFDLTLMAAVCLLTFQACFNRF